MNALELAFRNYAGQIAKKENGGLRPGLFCLNPPFIIQAYPAGNMGIFATLRRTRFAMNRLSDVGWSHT
jgi:hypothetical protein